MRIEWNDQGFNRLTGEILREEASKLQAAFGRVSEHVKGRTVEQVKVPLGQELRPGSHMEITDEELTGGPRRPPRAPA